MKKAKSLGFINAILAAVSYGTNPLFALPMYSAGMGVNSVLFYRYFFAVLIYALWLKFVKKVSLKITKQQFLSLLFISILFALSSLLLFNSFHYIDSGLACTILFIYPTMVALLSAIFFKEKLTKTVILAIILTFLGVILLYGGNSDEHLSLKGIAFVLLSALSYAIYIVCVRNMKHIKHIKYDKLSFYVMLMGLSVFIFNLKFCTQLQPITDFKVLACAFSLALFPTIISLETINIAIRLIGSTTTSVIGALEPLTAIFFGVLFFHEMLTLKIICGIILILIGVFVTIFKNSLKK